MSTNSAIGKMNEDGTVTSIYCHYDGYVRGVGKILKEHYHARSKIDQLLQLGSLSILGPEIGVKHNFNHPHDGVMCRAYHRDRGEDLQKADKCELFQYNKYEYNYVFTLEGQWKLYVNKQLVDF